MNTPDHFVRTQHRRLRHTALVWSLALAVLSIALAGAEKINWLRHGFIIGLAPAAAALVLVIYWLVRLRRIEQRAIARAYDSEWSLQARLEAASELSADNSAFAAAQRHDASQRLAVRPAPRAIAWRVGCAALVFAMLFALTDLGVFSYRLLTPAKAAATPAVEAVEDIGASIEWRSPQSEIKATSIEEIALVASSTSRTGFRSVTLEVSVNGEPRLSKPLDAALLTELAKKGTHEIKLPLYLDETTAVEFDIVAYHLRAERSTQKPSPAITSPLQFVQIRPARDDVARGGKPGNMKTLNLIGALKVAQLSLLKQNFLLAHAPISHTSAEWLEANAAVAKDQATLATKSAEVRTFAISEELPALVVDNLTQAIPLMEAAAKQIENKENESAAKPQGKALSLITEIEKLIRKIMGEAGAPPPPSSPSVKDPFKDEQRFKIPPRSSTPAGKLEQLAKDQTDQAKKLDPQSTSPSAGSPGDEKPKPADAKELARQAAQQVDLAARAEQLAKSAPLSSDSQKAAAQAAKDAAAAANQLKNGDVNAARSPAHAAADTLRAAADAQEKAGRETARAQLEAARRALNETAQTTDAEKRAEQLTDIAQKLQAEARAQQESGSAEAAQKLAAAAAEIAKTAKDAANKGSDLMKCEAPGSGGSSNAGQSDAPSPNAQPGPGKPSDQSAPNPSSPANAAAPVAAPGNALTKATPSASPSSSSVPSPSGSPGPSGSSPGNGGGSGSGSGGGSSSEKSPAEGSGFSTTAERAEQAAATAQAALSTRAEASARAARQLQRGADSHSESGSSGPGLTDSRAEGAQSRPAELVLGAQLARAILGTPEAAQLSATIVASQRGGTSTADVTMTPDLRAAVERLRALLAAAQSDDRRDETIRRFNPEDMDPAYRETIEAYFERLSREARRQ